MAVRNIVKFPDPRLRAVAAVVNVFDEELRVLADDLRDTMLAAPGVGITAPHLGVAKRVVVLKLSAAEPVQVYVNPKIVWASTETIRHAEGSVSMPGVTGEIERPARVKLSYQGLDGSEHSEDAEGFRAVCHQHEIDQLDGIFWIQRLSQLKRERVVKKYRKLRERD